MKFLHVADLHIGKKVHGFSMLSDQQDILQQIKEYIRIHRPEALLIAGDIYDRSNPAAEAIALFSNFIAEVLNDLATPILAIAGNHDGGELIGYGREIFQHLQLYIEGVPTEPVRRVVLRDEYGPVDFYLLPFADYQVVRSLLQQPEITDLDSAMAALIREIKGEMPANTRRVLLTHGYIAGGESPETCESEKPLSIGGKESVAAAHFADSHYVAAGHLHQAQRVGSQRIRYAGSPLKYSFSEEDHKKSATLVELDAAGDVQIQLLPLQPLHEMYTLTGSLQELLDNVRPEHQEAYLQIILTDDSALLEPKQQLDKCYNRIMLLSVAGRSSSGEQILNMNALRSRQPLELIEAFYNSCRSEPLTEADKALLVAGLQAAVKEEA